MASTINASTSAGLVQTADTSGVLQLQTNSGTTAITVDASQNVGIGTASPARKLTIQADDTNALPAATTAQLRIQGNTNTNYQMYIGLDTTTGYGYIQPTLVGTAYKDLALCQGGGNVLVGDTVGVSSRVYSKGATAVDGSYTYFGNNSAGTLLFFVRNDGVISTGSAANSPYNLTTASAANMYVASSGTLFRSTSSIKYKSDVKDAVHGLDKVMELRPVTYKGINDGDTVFGGLIAEEVHDAGLTEFVQYAEDGSPDALAYGQMVSLAFKAIQEQQTIINDLKARITALEGAA
jgi:hypothetical protein